MRQVLLEYDTILQGYVGRQHRACGEGSRRAGGPEVYPLRGYWLQRIRERVAEAYGLLPGTGDLHHPYSPWRFRILEALQRSAGDMDTEIIAWLRDDAASGIRTPITPGGHFPLLDDRPALPVEFLTKRRRHRGGNHPSFRQTTPEGEQPALAQLKDLMEQGFGQLFENRAAAERYLGEPCHPAPLGDVVKQVAGQADKHRLIQDLR